MKWKYNPLTTFYIVFTYIIVFAVWWMVLLFMKNETAYRETLELSELRYHALHPGLSYSRTAEFAGQRAKYERQKTMILTEGAVFLLLLVGGLWQVRTSIRREMQAMQQQSNFLHSVTHELKSPLAAIKLNVQTIQQRQLNEEQLKTLTEYSIADVERLEGLVENILLAARVESTTALIETVDLPVSELCENLLKRYTANTKGIRVIASVQQGLVVRFDRQSFVSMFCNLLDNAMKYSPAGSQVKVTLAANDQCAQLRVADQGPGIADAYKQRVFEKFFRIGKEETRATKGTGLGLYIVKRLAELNHGKVWVEDHVPNGCVFVIQLPLKT